MPETASMLNDFAHLYPEVSPTTLATHVWARYFGTVLEEAVEDFLARFEISPGRFIILMLLEFEEEGMKPSRIAQILGITQATVTGLIDGLQDSKWVSRKSDLRDRRACVVSLTDQGREFITTVRPQFNRWAGSLYSVWNEAEMNQFVSLVEKFVTGLKSQPGFAE